MKIMNLSYRQITFIQSATKEENHEKNTVRQVVGRACGA